jgi:thiamine biosynthesis lipoprotein
MNGLELAVSHVEHVMGMAVSFDIRPPLPADGALRPVLDWLHHVDAMFSTYKADSEISRFARGQVRVDDLTPDTADVLQTCRELTDVTDGAFDAFVVPAPNGTLLDPSGYVKGWAVERAAAMLQTIGATNFCINAGGDIAVRGTPGNAGEPWRVGIRHPSVPDQFAFVIEVSGPCAIATSATYERGAHIIDPRDGRPTTSIASATVIGPDLGVADAFATAVFVMGEDGLDWMERQPGYEAYIITNDEITMWTSGFPRC